MIADIRTFKKKYLISAALSFSAVFFPRRVEFMAAPLKKFGPLAKKKKEKIFGAKGMNDNWK